MAIVAFVMPCVVVVHVTDRLCHKVVIGRVKLYLVHAHAVAVEWFGLGWEAVGLVGLGEHVLAPGPVARS